MGSIIVIALAVAFYLLLGRGAKVSVTQQLLSKQQLLARAEAGNIKSFFQVFGESIAVLSQLRSIETQNSNAIKDMDTFVEQWRDTGLVDGIALTDSNGKVVLNSNIAGIPSSPISVSDRTYYLWARNESKQGEYFVGNPIVSRLGASKDQTIIPVASPVYENGTFTGVLVAAVELRGLTRHNLELMQVSNQSDVYLINNNGDLLYSNNFRDSVGFNILDYFKAKPFQGSQNLINDLTSALQASGEGSMRTLYLDPVSRKMEAHLLAYSPIAAGGQKWLLVIASPIHDIWDFTIPMYIRLVALAVLVAITIFLFGIIAIREVRRG